MGVDAGACMGTAEGRQADLCGAAAIEGRPAGSGAAVCWVAATEGRPAGSGAAVCGVAATEGRPAAACGCGAACWGAAAEKRPAIPCGGAAVPWGSAADPWGSAAVPCGDAASNGAVTEGRLAARTGFSLLLFGFVLLMDLGNVKLGDWFCLLTRQGAAEVARGSSTFERSGSTFLSRGCAHVIALLQP